jgi:DNA adenine methylase
MNSFIRWAGSKRQILPRLRPYWPGGKVRYIEPFCGSACLFFDLNPEEAILGDLNDELMTSYRAIRQDAGLVIESLRRIPRGKAAYYRLRSLDPRPLSLFDKAARFLYLNRLCFNGIYRTNQLGGFNVPYGAPKGKWNFDEAGILAAQSLLQKAEIVNWDFARTIAEARPGDFVYLDPPYAVEKRRIFTEYHPKSFNSTDLVRLEECLRTLDAKGATFLVSYADSREARKLLGHWKPKRIWTKRHIAGFASNRRGAYELLATNAGP